MQYLATIFKLYLCREKDRLFIVIIRVCHGNAWGIAFTKAHLEREKKKENSDENERYDKLNT